MRHIRKQVVLRLLLLAIMLAQIGSTMVAPQGQSESYAETRGLLLAMQRSAENRSFRKLFEEADERMSDLKQALYAPDKQINLNAQIILKYLADTEGLAAVDDWYSYRKKQGQEYWMPTIDLISEERLLKGSDRNITKLVLKNLHPSKDAWATIIAQNKRKKTILIEIVYGEIFTEGWHVAVREESCKWRVLSNTIVWRS
jgi:hypothetical protein